MHEEFMQAALRLAKEAFLNDELPVGAVVVWRNAIIGKGDRLPHLNTRLDHAEIQAIREAIDAVGPYEHVSEMCVYTTLEPCMMCIGAVLNSKIGKVMYALEDPYGGAAHIADRARRAMPPRHQKSAPEVIGGVCRREAFDLFRQYFQRTQNPFWRNNRTNPLSKLCLEGEL